MDQHPQFCLKWNNHQPNFISVFTTLLNTGSLADVTLFAEGKQLQAHKVVLSACSVYFQTLFTSNPSPHPIVILKDVRFADLRIIVDFVYYGEVNITEDQLPLLIETAKLLKIKGLTEMPTSVSLIKAQCTLVTEQTTNEQYEPQSFRVSSPPSDHSPSCKRRRYRRVSSGSNTDHFDDSSSQTTPKTDAITVSSLHNQSTHYNEETEMRHLSEPPNNINVDQQLDTNPSCLPEGGQWTMMEHPYHPRFNTSCISGGLQPDSTMAFNMNNAMNHHMMEMNDFGQNVSMTGPSPGPSCVMEPPVQQGPLPQITPQKRRRTSNPQSEENFQRALEAVRFGGIGFCKAARMFGVNNRTLWLEYKKKGYPNNRPSIKNRIKRENSSPPPENKEEALPPDQQMPLICPQHPVPVVGFIDSRQVDYPNMQSVTHSPINLHGLNFNTMQ